MTLTVTTLTEVDDAVRNLVAAALSELRLHRGGVALEADMHSAAQMSEGTSLLQSLAASSQLVAAYLDDVVVGVLALGGSPTAIMGIYVQREHRRRGVGRLLVNAARAMEFAPTDAWALPGDRATKSLFESVSWKARRLTMSDEKKESGELDARA